MQYTRDPKHPQLQTRVPEDNSRLRSCSDRPSGQVYRAKHRKATAKACTNTSENCRGRCVEHHWPNELLTAARATAPGRACWGQPYFMWILFGFHKVFKWLSCRFHWVFMGWPLDGRSAMF